jgi:hypothetical protein
MTDFNPSDRDVSRAIRSWLREDRHEDASRIAGAVLDHVEATPQRRADWLAWRPPTMNKFVTVGLGAAAVVALAILIGSQVLGSPGGLGTGSGSPNAASPSASSPPSGLEAYMDVGYAHPANPVVLHIYPPGDEMCDALDLSSACYQMVQPNKPDDMGSQGSAAMVDGLVALTITLCEFCEEGEVGSTYVLEPRNGGAILYGLRCEPEGVICPDQDLAWERQD